MAGPFFLCSKVLWNRRGSYCRLSFGMVLRRFQKVLRGIHSENQNHKRPNLFWRGYPSPPPGVSVAYVMASLTVVHIFLVLVYVSCGCVQQRAV